MVIRILKSLPLFYFLALFFCGSAFAANGTISVVPSSGNYYTGESFDADVRIDGGGESFNAAEATVSVSENLKIDRLTLGDCGFAFVDTPTVASPSFVGVNLGSSTNSCTLYTLTLSVVGQNSGFVYISDASLKSYQGANELLSKVNNSSYSLGSSQSVIQIAPPSPTQAPIVTSLGEKVYTLVYTISAKDGRASEYEVYLDPNQPNQTVSEVNPLPGDNTVLAAIFEDVPEGVHTIEIRDKDQLLSSEIVNIEGPNREVNFGVKPKPPGISIVNILIVATSLIVIISLAVLGYIFYWRRKHASS